MHQTDVPRSRVVRRGRVVSTVAAVVAALGISTAAAANADFAATAQSALSTPSESSSTAEKPRIVAMEDAEVDDMDSLIRLLYYSNEFDIAGIVATSSTFHYKGNMASGGTVAPFRWTGISWVNRYIDDYAQVLPNLSKHADGWPSPEYLRSVYKIGNIETVSDMSKATEGSEWIKKLILDNDDRPLYALAWGGTNTLARALQDIQTQYQGSSQWAKIQAKVNKKLVVYNILTQDTTLANYIKPNWPDVKIVDNTSQFWGFAYLWPRATPAALKPYLQAAYLDANQLQNTGPLMAEYRTYGDGNPTEGDDQNLRWNPANVGTYSIHDFISEGDSPSFMFLLDFNGLRSSEDPTYGGWGGRFTPNASGWKDTGDPLGNAVAGGPDALRFAQLRWLAEFQNDFSARIKWGVTPKYKDANHIPTASVREGLNLKAAAGQQVSLHAKASDPDKNALTYKWWEYTDADTYAGTTPVAISGADSLTPSLTIPADAKAGDTIHLILQVTDNGSPALTYYQRVIYTVVAAPTVTFAAPTAGVTVGSSFTARVDVNGESLRKYTLQVDGKNATVVNYLEPGVQKTVLSTSRLNPGQHTLTATVTDTYGQSVSAEQAFNIS
jgi:hypothetical protein